jgi:type IV secretory pathway VirJ component
MIGRHPGRALALAGLLSIVAAGVALAPRHALAAAARGEESFSRDPFGTVTLYRPAAPPSGSAAARPPHLVLFVSGDGGWKLGVVDMARELAGRGAAVAGIDITHYIRTVTGAAAAAPGACFNPGQDFADLGREVAGRLGTDPRQPPILVGYSSGATLVYAALVQAAPGAYAGAISLGFCPDLIVNMPICKGNGLAWKHDPHQKGVDFLPSRLLAVPWVALQGDIDKICTPADTRAYVHQVPHGELVWLPKVGHGFSVPRRWLPQLLASFDRVVRAADQR